MVWWFSRVIFGTIFIRSLTVESALLSSPAADFLTDSIFCRLSLVRDSFWAGTLCLWAATFGSEVVRSWAFFSALLWPVFHLHFGVQTLVPLWSRNHFCNALLTVCLCQCHLVSDDSVVQFIHIDSRNIWCGIDLSVQSKLSLLYLC